MKATLTILLLFLTSSCQRATSIDSVTRELVIGSDAIAAYEMRHVACGGEPDVTGNGHDGVYHGIVTPTPDGTVFDGKTAWLEVADAPELSVTDTGALTVEAWIRPDTLTFTRTDGSGYVNFIGKGVPGGQEYTLRMYSSDNSEGRENRISAYIYNAAGNYGAGSYFQDKVVVGQWMHVAAVYDTLDRGPGHETGTITIFRDGVQRDKDPLSGYNIVPTDGPAPLGIGARDNRSYFQGAISAVVVYGRALSQAEIASHAASRQ